MLENLSAFFGNDEAVLSDARDACTEVHYKRGSTILSQQDTSKSVYCLLSGTAKALIYSEDGDEVWLDGFKPGELFGEIAMLSGAPRTADIVATAKVSVAVFHEEAFLKLMEKHGSIGITLSKILAKRVAQTSRRLFELNAMSAKGRVYSEILRMAEDRCPNGNPMISDLPTFTTFAKRVNSTRETVSRTVNELERLNILERRGNQLIIVNVDALEELERW